MLAKQGAPLLYGWLVAIGLATKLWGIEIQGIVLDASTQAPIGGVFVSVGDSSDLVITQDDGIFNLSISNSKTVILNSTRSGYNSTIDTVLLGGATPSVDILMYPQITQLPETVVTGHNALTSNPDPVSIISRSELRGQIKNTIAETLGDKAGFAKRSSGPATARPVLRGIGDARLLVLEDGQNTGDLSASSPDHAIIIEPMATDNITVTRGPETVRYGSSNLAGVINANKNLIPKSSPESWTGNLALSGATVNSGWANNTRLEGAVKDFAVHADLVSRESGDMNTPTGSLDNTFSQATNYALGVGRITNKKQFGVAISDYDAKYGITGDAERGHPKGVEIHVARRRVEFEVAVPIPNISVDKKPVEWFHAFTRYWHSEFESSGRVGAEFGVITIDGGIRIPTNNSEFGFLYEHRDYASGGFTFTPPTREYAGGFYSFRNWATQKWKFVSSLRWDVRQITPRTEKVSTIGDVSEKQFHGFSGGASAQYQLTDVWNIKIILMRSYRPPSVEELFSGGPHLAAYSYEVGNPQLDPETGYGIELLTRWNTPNLKFNLAFFQNSYDNYLYLGNTGRMSFRRADLPLYQVRNKNALFRGAEGELIFSLRKHLSVFSTLSYLNGTFTSPSKQAMPQLPPLMWQTGVNWSRSPLTLRFAIRGASDQKKLGEFEQPTDGYEIFDFDVQFHFFTQNRLNTLKFAINNISNTVYRNHLNRIKSIMPEPGRDARLFYEIHF